MLSILPNVIDKFPKANYFAAQKSTKKKMFYTMNLIKIKLSLRD